MFGWMRQKQKAIEPDRYAGKPLLILLENYVLDCIGMLTEDKRAKLLEIVERVYGAGSDWKATLRKTLHLEEALDDNLRQLWVRNQEIARKAGQSLSPENFARMIVDQNFAQLIS